MDKEEKMELTHEPVPGYQTVFYVTLIVGVIYLGIIFVKSF